MTGGRPELNMVNPGAAAIDIGSKMHMAAVNPDSTEMPVRAFGTFTHDLHDLAVWFRSCGATSVAEEFTGVYWIPAFNILEQHGFHAIIVNARYAKNAPSMISNHESRPQTYLKSRSNQKFRPVALLMHELNPQRVEFGINTVENQQSSNA